MRDPIPVSGNFEGQRNQWQLCRWHNTCLLKTLPIELRSRARNHLEAEHLRTKNPNPLQATQAAMERPDGD